MAAATAADSGTSIVPDDRLPHLLGALRVHDERASDAASQRRLLRAALNRAMRLQTVLAGAAAAAAGAGATGQQQQGQGQQLLDPAALEACAVGKVFGRETRDAMFTIQEKLMDDGPDIGLTGGAWLEARRTLLTLLTGLQAGGAALRAEAPGGPGVALEVVGARWVRGGPDGKARVPMLELRFWTAARGGAGALDWPPHVARMPRVDCKTADEVLLLTALLDAGAAALAPAHAASQEALWAAGGGMGTGARGARAGALLPVSPLVGDVKLPGAPSSCAVCGKEGAKACSGCYQAHYCSAEHQKQDWPRHKAACRRARQEREQQAAGGAAAGAAAAGGAAAASGAAAAGGAAGDVMVTLQEELPFGPAGRVATAVPLNQNLRGAARASGPGRFMTDVQPAPKRAPDPAKRFLVKVQAPLTGSGPLMLYDEGRRVMAFVAAPQQPPGTHAALERAVRARGWQGVKAYFWATLESGARLVVHTGGALPGQTHSW
ncbi:MAG: hypothetical protein J3K34DRAFT_520215 [Monoraphidium minutum]|nr:MAG: hypothetical protein J3K34DRAFT_520215 [Monoraphidium minutum]